MKKYEIIETNKTLVINLEIFCLKKLWIKANKTIKDRRILFTKKFNGKKKFITRAKKPINIKPNKPFSSNSFLSSILKIIFFNKNPLIDIIKHIKEI